MEYVRDLMIKVDKGLDLVVGTSVPASVTESVQAKGVSKIGSLDVGIFVHASVTMPSEGAVGSQAPIADEVGTSVQGSFLVEGGGPPKVSSTLKETVEPLIEDANGVTQDSASPLEEADTANGQGLSRGGANTRNVDGGEEPVLVTNGGDNNHIVVEQPFGGKEILDFSLVPRVEEGLELGVQSGGMARDNVVPLVSLPPINDIAGSTTDWILKKDNGFLQTLRLSYGEHGEYEDQFKILLTAIEGNHALETKSKFKKSRELKNLSWAINYDAKGASSSRGKAKGRAFG
ncbi:hypothetical protein F2P56_014879 [Juglans regia]|uniref:Uncharacterized protein n=1 Tax=Juglans regia TaxID=51240 RepID=A0A834CLW7_JUGRE|nr:hypothetical protein F2P56_014879 [Juglans regia]